MGKKDKNKYRKLKQSILLQTIFITTLTVFVGSLLLEFVIDGSYNDIFAETFVSILKFFNVEETRAIELYWSSIGNNKPIIVVIGFFILFGIFFYVALSQITKYLNQITDGIDNINSDSGEPISLIPEFKPIEMQLNEIKSTIKRQARESTETEKKKNDMVVFLAHDLKTPLTSIVAYLSMLDSRPDMPVEERKKYTNIALEKSIRLGELINEFFEITRFNLHDVMLEQTRWNLSRMLEQLADESYGIFREKNLTCEVEAEEGIIVNADADKLARVFDNLLRNAVSYCYPNTEILITVEQKEDKIEIVFENSGEPIPLHKQRMIFEKFYRADDSRSSVTGGAGLGLAISKEIIEAHRGTIRAISEGTQNKFIVVLPAEGENKNGEVSTSGRRAPRSKAGRGKGL